MKFKRAKAGFLILPLLIPMLFLTHVNIAVAYSLDTDVDILFAGDEEIMDCVVEWPDPIWWWMGVFYDRPLTEIIEEECFPGLQASFSDQLGINIVFHGWANWESDDSENNAYWLLQDAIEQVQGYWVDDPLWPIGGGYWKFDQDMEWNGVLIDILVAWTLQGMYPRGFAPFKWGAAIVQYIDIPRAGLIPQHEISHLYSALHCSHSYCIMNPDYAWICNDWRSTCKDYMITHKNCFTRAIGGGGAGPGPEPCPTLFVWDGTDYVDLGVIDIHADGDVVREVPVPPESVSVNNCKAEFRLREGWEGLTYSHSQIDQVKLDAVDSDGNRHPCPLVNATHSELGNVLPRLLLSDDWRCDMYLLETIDLEFVVSWQTDEIEDFAFVIEGCNMIKM